MWAEPRRESAFRYLRVRLIEIGKKFGVLRVYELRQPAPLAVRPVVVGGVGQQVVAGLAKARDDSALEQRQWLSAMFHAST